MIVQRQPEEIETWHLAFFANDRKGWARFLPGRFKHVAAFAYSARCRTWLILDVHWRGVRAILLPEGQDAIRTVADWTAGGEILKMAAKPGIRFGRFGFYCVPFVAHLVGCRGALLPDGLWRSCLKGGATIVDDGKHNGPEHSATAGPLAAAATTGGGAST